MRALLVACSKTACERMWELKAMWEAQEPETQISCLIKCAALPELSETESLTECVGKWFHKVDAIVFLCACGIAVRSIAPWIVHKAEDPAVLVMDETEKFCISLLSGHWGGANALAQKLSHMTGAVPVVTTATDREEKFAVDVFAQKNGLLLHDWKLAKTISAKLLEGERIGFYSEIAVEGSVPEELCVLGKNRDAACAGEETCEGAACAGEEEREGAACAGEKAREGAACAGEKAREGAACAGEEAREGAAYAGEEAREGAACAGEKGVRADAAECGKRQAQPVRIGIAVSCRKAAQQVFAETLLLMPRIVVAGVGCRKGTPEEKIEAALNSCLEEAGLCPEAVCAVASIDLKREEEGILSFCRKQGLPFVTFSAEELERVDGDFSRSAFVESVTGVSNVCERSAVAAAKGKLLCGKKIYGGVTVALAQKKAGVRF